MNIKRNFLRIVLLMGSLLFIAGCSGNEENPALKDADVTETAPKINILQQSSAESLESPPAPVALVVKQSI